MNNIPKIKLGIVAVSRDCFPESLSVNRRKALVDAYKAKYKLYELEETLPRFFMRVSKSTILNTNHIFSIDRNLTASSVVAFTGTHKQVYVSRYYYKPLISKLEEKRLHR